MYNCLLLKFTFILTLVLFLTCSEEINTSNKLLSVTKNHPAENMRGVKRKSPAADGIIIDTINSSKSFDFNIIKGMNQINIKDAKTYALNVISCDITGFRKELLRATIYCNIIFG